eukprot:c23712_g5_i1 orf=400-1935(-)
MVSSESKISMVIAGRGARACDMCGKERSRWYCAADEAYLCEKCDGLVHSANAVAKRHERVKLGPNGAPVKLKPSHNHHRKSKVNHTPAPQSNPSQKGDAQKWCSSSRKRSRTPRKGVNLTGNSLFTSTPTVNPESLNTAIIKEEKDEALLLYDLLTADDQPGDLSGTATFDVKPEPFSPTSTLTSRDFLDLKVEETEFAHEVPTYEPLLQDLIASSHGDLMEKIMPSSPSLCNDSCMSRASTTTNFNTETRQACPDAESRALKIESTELGNETEPLHMYDLVEGSTCEIRDSISISEDSDIDTFDVMDLCSNANFDENMKVEESLDMEIWKAAYRLDQGACASIFEGNPFKGKGERDLDVGCMSADGLQDGETEPLQQWPSSQPGLKRPLSLQLDYEDVINAWSDRGSLWMNGQRPQIVPDISFLDHGSMECGMMMVGESSHNSSMGSQAGQVPSLVVTDSGREARVLRYKEKRRTRLFSKKIRYEVRKLNAERRPRMKGRFVKRTAIAAM